MKIEYNKVLNQPIKIIEVYIDIYLMDLLYDGNDKIIYKDVPYKPRSREEFYLSKQEQNLQIQDH